jgi:hypothetical protein
VLTLVLFLTISSNAQSVDCQQCSSGPLQQIEIDLCTFSNVVTWHLVSNPSIVGTTTITDAPLVKIFINYRIQTCPDGTSALLIEDCVYLDTKDYWENDYFPNSVYVVTSGDVVPAADVQNCIYSIYNTTPPTDAKAKMNMAINEAINRLLNAVGVTSQVNYTVFRKEGCYSTVKIKFPVGSFIVSEPNDNGQTTTRTFSASNSTIMQNIPCNEICCKSVYKWEVVTMTNGETRSIWTKVSTSASDGECENQPMPIFSNYNNRLRAKTIDPITGDTIIVEGTVIEQSNCTPACTNTTEPPTEAKISKNIGTQTTVVTLTPSLNNEFVTLESNKTIKNVDVYSINGQKVEQHIKYENNKLYLTSLIKGIYFAKIQFNDNSYQTVKFVK